MLLPGVILFPGMVALGWYLAAPPLPTHTGEAPTPETISHGSKRPGTSSRDRDVAAARMRVIRDAASPAERLRLTISLANSLPPSEFAAWMEGDRFSFRKGPELSVFRMIIFERWIQEDPDSLIPWAGKNNHGQAGRALIFLANNSPQRLIDHYRDHPDERTELATLKEMVKNHPELSLHRLQELSAGGLSSGTTRAALGLLVELAKKSPAALEAVLDTLSPDLRKQADVALSGQRLTTSFQTEIRALWERPDGFQVFDGCINENSALAEGLISGIGAMPETWKSSLAENPYNFIGEKNAKDWFHTDLEAAGFSPSQALSLKREALDHLASSDPEFMMTNLESADVDLRAKARLISSALRSAKGDGAEVEKLINLLGSEESKELARTQLKQLELTSNASKPPEPSKWLETIGGSDDTLRPYQVLGQLNGRDKAWFADLRSGFAELPSDQKLKIGRIIAAGGMSTEIDPAFAGEAIRALVTGSPSAPESNNKSQREDPVMASSTYAVQLAMTDPAAATSWINTLPEGDAKLWAYKNVAANWQQYDPKAVAQWLQTLPADARAPVAEHLRSRK